MLPASEPLDNSFENEPFMEVDYTAQADIFKKMAERDKAIQELGDLESVFDQLKNQYDGAV